MLTTPMKLSSPLFGPHPRLGQQRRSVSEPVWGDLTLFRSNIPHMCGSKLIEGESSIITLIVTNPSNAIRGRIKFEGKKISRKYGIC